MPQVNRDPQLIPNVLKDNLVQLPPVPVQRRRGRAVRSAGLEVHHLARVPLVDVEALVPDRQLLETLDDGAVVAPAAEDAAGVGAEGDDVAEDLELGEGFVDLDRVALAVALDGGGQAAEARADDDDLDACLMRHWVEVKL